MSNKNEIYQVNVHELATSCEIVIEGDLLRFTASEGAQLSTWTWANCIEWHEDDTILWRVTGSKKGLIPAADNIKYDAILNSKRGLLKIINQRTK